MVMPVVLVGNDGGAGVGSDGAVGVGGGDGGGDSG